MSDELQFVSAATEVKIDGWPMGGSKRGLAIFKMQETSRGQRIVRKTLHMGRESKPKTTTYGKLARILICSDGLTWTATTAPHGEMITIGKSDLKQSQETIFQSSQPERYAEVLELMKGSQIDVE